MSDQANFLGKAPARGGLVGHLEDTVAQKMAPRAMARFGPRVGMSPVTLPGSGAGIVVPKAFRRGDINGDPPMAGIGKRRDQRQGLYF